MSKRVLALVLTLLLSMGVLAACATNTPASSQKPVPASSVGSEAPVSSEPEEYKPTYPIVPEMVTFTAAFNNDGGKDHNWYKAYEKATNVVLDFEYWSDWNTQAGVALVGDTIPDILINPYGGVDKDVIYDYGKQGKFINYKDYLQFAPDLVALMDARPESYPCVENADGSMYCTPRFTDTLTSFNGSVFYRTDMFKEAGIAVPKTTDEFLQAAKDLQTFYGKDNADFIAVQPHSNGHLNQHLMSWLLPAFGPAVDMEFGAVDGKTVTYTPISDQYRHLLEFMSELYNSGAFDKNIFAEDGTNANPRVKGDKAAIFTNGTGIPIENFKSGHYDCDLFAPLTSEYASEQKYRKATGVTLGSFCISSKCSDPETLVKYVNALYTTEENEIAPGVSGVSMWLGVRGVDWKYDDDSKKTYTVTPPATFEGTQIEYLAKYGCSNAANCIFRSLNSSNVGLVCKGAGYRDNLLPFSVTAFPKGYLTISEDDSDTIATLMTDINTTLTDNRAAFIQNGVTDETWEKFVNEVKTNGIEEVVAIYQKAFDAYNAK